VKRMTAAAQKGRDALEEACDLYEQGDFKNALAKFREAAVQGSLQAQINLGNMFDAGEGVEKNFAAAVRCYKVASKKGSAEAAFNLAVSYRNRGQIRWARFWFQRASELGDADAIGELDKIT
jgi:TPR repeat protein